MLLLLKTFHVQTKLQEKTSILHNTPETYHRVVKQALTLIAAGLNNCSFLMNMHYVMRDVRETRDRT